MAIKLMSKRKVTKFYQMQSIASEFTTLKILCHDNIVRLVDTFHGVDYVSFEIGWLSNAAGHYGRRNANSTFLSARWLNDKVYAVFDYIDGPDLQHYIDTKYPISINIVRSFFSQVANALYYIHSRGICHRDLKVSMQV